MSAPCLIVRNGRVCTGSPGAALIEADVLIAEGRVVRVSPDVATADAEVLDASGCVVSPGFVDIHAHSDQSALTFPGAESKVCDGVTTEVNGNCGLTLFPYGVDLRGNVSEFRSAAEFMSRVERVGTAVNRAYLIGHGAVRRHVMGMVDRAPTRGELAAMGQLVAQSLDEGAVGLSSGLGYAPGCFAVAGELAALCEVVATRGGIYATHIRNEGDRAIESVEEALVVARASGVRLQIGHLKTLGRENWGKVDALGRLLREARADGVDVTADRYPYLACSTSLAAVFSLWLMDGGPERAAERLRDPACRRRLREERSTEFGREMPWESVIISSVRTRANRHWVGHPISAVAYQRGQDPVDAALDLLAEEQTRVGVVVFAMDQGNLAQILNWPFVMVASDAGARSFVGEKGHSLPHPRAFGTFSRVLGRIVRQDRSLDLVEAIAKMTSLPAERIGLRQRGRITEGNWADITVFDPDRIIDRSTFEDPFQPSEGIRHVLVNGVQVLRDGELTHARPGRVLRKGVDVE